MLRLASLVTVAFAASGFAFAVATSAALATPQDDAVVKAIVGCHAIAAIEVDAANPSDPAVLRVKDAKSLCLADSQAAERVTVSAKAASGDVVGSWTFAVADEPLRCKGCYLLVGADGKLDWDGEAHATKASEPRNVTVRAAAMGATFRFILK